MAATSAFRVVPNDIRNLADEIARHAKKEEALFRDVLLYLADFNKVRCEAVSSDPHANGGPSTLMQVPRCPPQISGGLFKSNLMGDEAATFLKGFHPDGYSAMPTVDCDDSIFSMCLQGVNVSKAVKLWLETLLWPPDVDCDDASNWGASWFELAVSFYLYTGFRFPVRIGVLGTNLAMQIMDLMKHLSFQDTSVLQYFKEFACEMQYKIFLRLWSRKFSPISRLSSAEFLLGLG